METTEICAHCGGETARGSAACSACGKDPRLADKYRLLRRLGHGAVGTTFAAVRESDGVEVAVKELLVRRLEDFKAHDLFTREAGVLRMLQHPAIPRYYDDFAFGEGRQTGLYLVTELIDGDTLEAEMKTRRHSQKEVLQIIRELCDVLVYLHGLAPPVVHRDIKASNVMRRRADGRLVLIDFGAVKESLRQAGDGSTVAGTFGYMPPEQLAGRASPASDIYALGVLCVVLMTRTPAQELLDDQNRLQWREHVTSEPLQRLLMEMLDPDPARRLRDAGEVARRLDDIIAGRTPALPARAGGGFARNPVEEIFGLRGVGRMVRKFSDVLAGVQHHPVVPGIAEPPPPTPRPVPRGFAGRSEPVASFMRWFGILFGGVPLIMSPAFLLIGGFGAFFFLFTIVGAVMAVYGFKRVARSKRMFREGAAVPAVVTESFLNTSVRINGRSPWKIRFEYQAPDGSRHEGEVSRFRTLPEFREPGAKVYALVDPDDPSRATLWPL